MWTSIGLAALFWGVYWAVGFYLLTREPFDIEKQLHSPRSLSLHLPDVVPVLIRNMVVIIAARIILFSYPSPLDPFHPILGLLFSLLLLEGWFYVGHRLLHTRWLYQHIHKIHHEYPKPHALTAMYGHWFESVAVNFMAMAIGPWLTGMPLFLMVPWTIIGAVDILMGHHGHRYCKWLDNSAHDLHHIYLQGNYGIMGWLDWVGGTQIRDQK